MLSKQIVLITLSVALVAVAAWSAVQQDRNLPELSKLKLEYAVTPAEQELGLSYRESLDEDAGILFVYQEDVVPQFWMKEMHFPLDIVWLDENFKIIGIEKNIAPETYPRTFSPVKPIRYVLELNAGKSAKLGWEIGDKAL